MTYIVITTIPMMDGSQQKVRTFDTLEAAQQFAKREESKVYVDSCDIYMAQKIHNPRAQD